MITHAELEAFGARIERLMDRMHGELKDDLRSVHARVSEQRDAIKELRDEKKAQNGRLGRAEDALTTLTGKINALAFRQRRSGAASSVGELGKGKLVALVLAALAGMAGMSEAGRALADVLKGLAH